MKYISNNEADGVLDRLLKAEIGRASRAGTPCGQFDPDFSAAYIERNLTSGEAARYEVHLAACPVCRIQVARLARSGYEADLTSAAQLSPSLQETALSLNSRPANRTSDSALSRIFDYLLRPQWIAAATAALVLLVAIPIFIILKNAKQAGQSSFAPQSPAGVTNPESAERSGSLAIDQRGVLSDADRVTKLQQSRSEPESSDGAVTRPTSNPPPQAGDVGTGLVAASSSGQAAQSTVSPSEPVQKTEEKSGKAELDRQAEANQIAQNRSQENQQNALQNSPDRAKAAAAGAAGQVEERLQAKDQSPAAPNQVSAVQDDKEASTKGGERAAPSEQISPRDAQTLPDDNNKKVSIIRPGGVSTDGSRAKEGHGTIRPKDSEPPRPEATHDETERRIAKGPSSREFAVRSRTDADSVRKPTPQPLAKSQKLERRVENKRFRLQAGFWTDKEFKPDKEIPAVTLVRDSDVYKSAIEKQPGLRAFLAGFGPDERVIVVYKKIIYTVLPPRQ